MRYRHTRKPIPAFPPAPESTQERIDYVKGLLRTLQWERGVTGPHLAKAWGFSTHAVDRWVSEAWRAVKAEVSEPDYVTATVATSLEEIIHDAREEIAQGDEDYDPSSARRSIISAGKTWAEVVGAMAPTRVKVEEVPAKLSDEDLAAILPEALRLARERGMIE